MAKLSDTQLVILAAAAKREVGSLLPLPKTLTTDKAAVTSALKSLLKRGLAKEQPTSEVGKTWRGEKDGTRHALVLTAAGLEAIGAMPKTAKPAQPSRSKAVKKDGRPRKAEKPADAMGGEVRFRTKLAALIELLSRKEGATNAEAMAATGWQAHSVRGAISGALKKKLGLTITSEVIEGRGRIYSIAPKA